MKDQRFGQWMGVGTLAAGALLLLAWMFSVDVAVTEDAPTPFYEHTPIIEVPAPQGVRCFAMIDRYSNEPEALSCVTRTTTTPTISGASTHSRQLHF